MNSADYLTYYATKFRTVEIDSTFYATPAATTVTGWGLYHVRASTERGISCRVPTT